MKLKKFIQLGTFAVTMVLLLVTFVGNRSNNYKYNMNPDLSKKIVGSYNYAQDMMPVEKTEDLVEDADLIIVGEVMSRGVERQFNMFGDDEIAQRMLQKGVNPYLPCTISNIKVEQIIYGNSEQSTIQLFELGKPDLPDLQTKVAYGQRLVMILRNSDTENMYYANNGECSLFVINDDGTLFSLSDQYICARYDGIDQSVLIEDLVGAI